MWVKNFLKSGGHGGESRTQVAAQPQQPQPTQSGYNYPPPTQNGYNYPTPRPTPHSGYNYNAPERGLRYLRSNIKIKSVLYVYFLMFCVPSYIYFYAMFQCCKLYSSQA